MDSLSKRPARQTTGGEKWLNQALELAGLELATSWVRRGFTTVTAVHQNENSGFMNTPPASPGFTLEVCQKCVLVCCLF